MCRLVKIKNIVGYGIKAWVPLSAISCATRITGILKYFRSRPYYTGAESSMFFIVGPGRSGNTLLRSMLVAGGEVCIPPESYVLPKIVSDFKTYSYLPWPKLASLIVSEFETYPEFETWGVDLAGVRRKAMLLPENDRTLENVIELVYDHYRAKHFPNAWLVGDKTPINAIFIRRIMKAYPSAKYIHILRDPRASVASYLKSGMKDQKSAIDFWVTATKGAIHLEKNINPSQFLRVHYEELVRHPEEVLTHICQFLGVEFRPSMLEHWKITSSLGDATIRSHHKNISQPISTKSVDAWKTALTSTQQRDIEEACLDLYVRLARGRKYSYATLFSPPEDLYIERDKHEGTK